MKEMNFDKSVRGMLLVLMTSVGRLVFSGTCGADVPVLVGVVVLFDPIVDWVRSADLKFEGLDFSVDVVVVSIRGGRLVEQVEECGDKDEGSGKRIKHERSRVAR